MCPVILQPLASVLHSVADENDRRELCSAYLKAAVVSSVVNGGLNLANAGEIGLLLTEFIPAGKKALLLEFFHTCQKVASVVNDLPESIGEFDTGGSVPASVSVNSSVSSGRAARRARARMRARQRAADTSAVSAASVESASALRASDAQLRAACAVGGLVEKKGFGYCYLRMMAADHVERAAEIFGPNPRFADVAAQPASWFAPFEVLAELQVRLSSKAAHVCSVADTVGDSRVLTLFRSVRNPVAGSVAQVAVQRFGIAFAHVVDSEDFLVGMDPAEAGVRERQCGSYTLLSSSEQAVDQVEAWASVVPSVLRAVRTCPDAEFTSDQLAEMGFLAFSPRVLSDKERNARVVIRVEDNVCAMPSSSYDVPCLWVFPPGVTIQLAGSQFPMPLGTVGVDRRVVTCVTLSRSPPTVFFPDRLVGKSFMVYRIAWCRWAHSVVDSDWHFATRYAECQVVGTCNSVLPCVGVVAVNTPLLGGAINEITCEYKFSVGEVTECLRVDGLDCGLYLLTALQGAPHIDVGGMRLFAGGKPDYRCRDYDAVVDRSVPAIAVRSDRSGSVHLDVSVNKLKQISFVLVKVGDGYVYDQGGPSGCDSAVCDGTCACDQFDRVMKIARRVV